MAAEGPITLAATPGDSVLEAAEPELEPVGVVALPVPEVEEGAISSSELPVEAASLLAAVPVIWEPEPLLLFLLPLEPPDEPVGSGVPSEVR
jgi:hypothetical protein